MNEDILNQILKELKIISNYIAKKAEKEQLHEDLDSTELDSIAAAACAKVGERNLQR